MEEGQDWDVGVSICQRGRAVQGWEMDGGGRWSGAAQMCPFALPAPPKRDGQFGCGRWHGWAGSPRLCGGHRRLLALSTAAVALSVLLWSQQQVIYADHVPSKTECPASRESHPAQVPVLITFFKQDKVTLYFRCICCEVKSYVLLVGQTLIWGAPKSLQMVNATIKLKDAYSLEGKLWPT